MSPLKQEALKIIENMQDDVMEQVVVYLQGLAYEKGQQESRLNGFHILQSFAGTLPKNFDAQKELEEAREEKYGRFN